MTTASIHNNIEIVQVTPEIAEEWLRTNTHNRNLRQHHVAALARDMAAGDWQWNGEAIKFSADNVLLDGQHRLTAIAASGATIPMLVIRNVRRSAQATMDAGSSRTAGDALKLRGESYSAGLAALIRRAILWDRGARSIDAGGRVPPTTTQIIHYLDENPELRDQVRQGQALSATIPLPSSLIALALRILSAVDYDDAQHFFARLASDEGHYKGEPIRELRHTLERNAKAPNGKYSNSHRMALIIKAWNKYRNGETVHSIRFAPGGANPEKFPEAH